jgi:hypothetical protein
MRKKDAGHRQPGKNGAQLQLIATYSRDARGELVKSASATIANQTTARRNATFCRTERAMSCSQF